MNSPASRFQVKLGAVVQLVDRYTRQPAEAAAPRFLLDDRDYRPQAKAQAFYAFVDLAPGQYTLEVLSPAFLPACVTLEVPMATPLADGIVVCELDPGPLYPYPAGTTVIRGRITAAQNGNTNPAPQAGVTIRARYQTALGRERAAETHSGSNGAYDGRYALPLPGRLAASTEVQLSFEKAGHPGREQLLTVSPGSIVFVDAALD